MSTQPFDFTPTGNSLVDQALERLSAHSDQSFQSLQATLRVQAEVESRMASLLAQQAQLLEAHSKLHLESIDAIQRHEKWLQDWEITKSEMDEKINFLIDRDMRREGGPESK